MEPTDVPECPVCLQTYDGECTIPRVLSCGHTTCESCLKSLPQKYPQTIRCPACVQLVKFPSQGPSSLPKNIDLLRLIPSSSQFQNPQKAHKKSQNCIQDHHHHVDSVSRLWSDEFYAIWKNWVLPKDDALIKDKEKRFGNLTNGNKMVRFFKVADGLLVDNGCGSVFDLTYGARIMNFLYKMKEEAREEVGLILKVCSKQLRICKVYGLWPDLEDGFLYLACERLNSTVSDHLSHFENGLSEDGLSSFAMMGMEMCEAMIASHVEGLFLGCLSLSCFEFDDFGHVSLNLSEVLETARIVRECVTEAGSSGKEFGVKEMGMLASEFFKRDIFVSPEMLFEVLKKEGIVAECDNFSHLVVHSYDVWSLACIFLRLVIGDQFVKELVDYVNHFIAKVDEENGLDWSGLYTGLLEKVQSLLRSKLGDEFESLQQVLHDCLNLDPVSHPPVINLWKCVRELVVGNQFDTMLRSDAFVHDLSNGHCLALGELSFVPKKRAHVHNRDEEFRAGTSTGENLDQVEEARADKNLVEGLLEGKVASTDMFGHLDCVTGLAIGGGFLFSSSYDKSVRAWSLQDFSLVHTFLGHEHKVMAVVYVDEEQPLCISGDSGGGIFLWSITLPLKKEPLKKWHEQTDWRYSGIHALTTAGNGYLYTGSGDRTVKAWSLQDGSISCTMDGHKSVVSTLAACDGVLYSGSWDGTIRLWSLSDHSLLTVLGEEDTPGTVTSVLSIAICLNILVAAYEKGHIKVWKNDMFMKSMQLHNGAILAVGMDGRCLFTGGWDKTIKVQELSGDEFQVDAISIGSISGSSVITSLLCWQGKLCVGHGDRTIKVYYYGE